MKTWLVLGKDNFILAKVIAETQEQVIETLEREKDKKDGPLIFDYLPVNKFIYDQWKANGERIQEENAR